SSQIIVSGTTGVCPGNQYTYTASASGTSYSWTYPSGWTKVFQAGNQIVLYVPSYNPQYGTVRVSITNSCGTSPYSGVTVYPSYSCGGYLTAGEFIIYPNPADEQLSIEKSNILTDLVQGDSSTNQSLELTLNTTQKAESFHAKLYDAKQLLVAEGVSQDNKIQLDTSKLPSGTYYLNIHYKEAVLQKQIVIE
ncbi:MAG: T9SS type A sorting domain-containing protein, partial [Cyclobacteriaceae bacterium]